MASSASSENVETNPRFDWYQSDAQVVLTVFVKQIKPDGSSVKISDSDVELDLVTETGFRVCRVFHLEKVVKGSQSSYKILPSKLELRLAKSDGAHWSRLEQALDQQDSKSSSKTPRNWDKLVKELDDKADESDLNQLFQKIYEEGSDEVKKAMNKSFLESGGTELNTNWSAVGTDKVSIKPPDGMEWRTWDK